MRKFLAIALIAWSGAACAGTGYYVTFVNQHNEPVQFSAGGSDDWYPEEFANDTTLAPGATRTLYTEDVESTPGIVGLNLSGGPYQGGHLEIWQGQHDHSVTQSLSWFRLRTEGTQAGGDYYIGTNNSRIRTAITARRDGFFNTVHATVIFR